MIYINSDQGRIGQFWWFNSNNVEYPPRIGGAFRVIYIDSDQGRIGRFWWFNSNNVDRIWMGNVSPWVNRWCIRWGSCGFGRNVHIYMEPLDD